MIRGFLRQGRLLRPSRVQYGLRQFSDEKKPPLGLEFQTLNKEIGQEQIPEDGNSVKAPPKPEIKSDVPGSSSTASTPASKPWYLRDQPEVKEEPVNIDLGLPEGAMNDIAKQLARDAVYDIKYVADQNILIGSGKSSRHIYKAGREVMGVLKHQHDVLPTAEGLFKKNAQRMSYRRMLKKARKQNLEFPDSEWVVIDSQMGFHVHIFTAEKRSQVNLEDLYKFEMDEEEVEIEPEDFEWAEKGQKNVIDGDEFLSGQQNSDPFLRSDSITGLPKKPSNNPFDGGIGSGQRRSMHTSAAADSAVAMDIQLGVEEREQRPSVVPYFMYSNWAHEGKWKEIMDKLDYLEPHPDLRVQVLKSFLRYMENPKCGYNDVPEVVEQVLKYFSPVTAEKAEWNVVFACLGRAHALNYKTAPAQALVDILVAKQAYGFAVTNKQIEQLMQMCLVDTPQFDPPHVVGHQDWQHVVDAKVLILKQIVENFGTIVYTRLMANDKFVRNMAQAITQRTPQTFGIEDQGDRDETFKHPHDPRIKFLEEMVPVGYMHRSTLFVFLCSYANSYHWDNFTRLLKKCKRETANDEFHVEMVVSLVLNSRDERAYLYLLDENMRLLTDRYNKLHLNRQSAGKLDRMMNTCDPEGLRFQDLRAQTARVLREAPPYKSEMMANEL